jgi:hypothetical protein
MSEEKGEYKAGTGREQGEQYEIRDEAPHDHYASIPNMVDNMGLSPYAYRLYCHFKRVTGEYGACWQSTTTLAKTCKMSLGMISKAKKELTLTHPPLIRIERKVKSSGDWYHEVRVRDIWFENHATFSQGERPDSPCEIQRSPCESKKNPVKNNPIQDDEQNSEIQPIFQCWKTLHGSLTPSEKSFLREILSAWKSRSSERVLPSEVICSAITKTSETADHPKSREYTRKILETWIEHGYGWKEPTRVPVVNSSDSTLSAIRQALYG